MSIMNKWIAIACMGVSIIACKHEGNPIQKQFVRDRVECRKYAEQTMGRTPMMASNQGHLHLVAQFANCMNKRGWSVNKPEKKDRDRE